MDLEASAKVQRCLLGVVEGWADDQRRRPIASGIVAPICQGGSFAESERVILKIQTRMLSQHTLPCLLTFNHRLGEALGAGTCRPFVAAPEIVGLLILFKR